MSTRCLCNCINLIMSFFLENSDSNHFYNFSSSLAADILSNSVILNNFAWRMDSMLNLYTKLLPWETAFV